MTQVPVLTMPGGDITHPVPDLTGYITEGQLVLSHELHVRGVYPPFDPLRSLSRLMRLGAGEGKTRDDHLEIAAQLYALVAQARRIADLAEVVGADALSEDDRRYLELRRRVREPASSRRGRTSSGRSRTTLERAWQRRLDCCPRRELTMVSERLARRPLPEPGRDGDQDAPG